MNDRKNQKAGVCMTGIQLVKPEAISEKSYWSYINDWKEAGETIIPVASAPGTESFEAQVHKWKNEERGVDLPAGWVSSSLYFLINEDHKILGAVHIRHELTEALMKLGGHIGYGIRPDERRKGYATAILQQALTETEKFGISEVLVTCDDDNPGSFKAIESNGGVRDPRDEEENGVLIRRYWIR